ncbi:MAG: NAD(P)-binding protein, partial [Desulfobacula sp.]|nr:NAD(P)-binding protein [Desulfobacula sp.]
MESSDKLSDKLTRRKFLKTLIMASSAAAIDWTGFEALADSIPNKKQFPIIVIGAGLGGLVSAAYLSKHGFDLTLMEQHSIPGGYATSFDREDFAFDVSLHATVAEHAMPQMILSDLGIWDKLTVAYTPELKRIITPDFDVTLPAKNPEGVKKELSRVFPHEKQGIYNFYTEMEQVISELWSGKRFKTSMMGKLEKLSLEEWMSL